MKTRAKQHTPTSGGCNLAASSHTSSDELHSLQAYSDDAHHIDSHARTHTHTHLHDDLTRALHATPDVLETSRCDPAWRVRFVALNNALHAERSAGRQAAQTHTHARAAHLKKHTGPIEIRDLPSVQADAYTAP